MAENKKKAVPGTNTVDRVGSYTREEFIDRVRAFHGYAAPGVIAGGIMVDMALEQIPKGTLFDAICETSTCLPDSIQLLTPCTVGNGWLKIINLGRFAICLYDKHTGQGVRVHLDPQKMKEWDELQAWLLKLKPKSAQNEERLQEQIWKAGRGICILRSVQVKPAYLTKRSKGEIGVCSKCGEAYPVKDGPTCLGCQGEAPYL